MPRRSFSLSENPVPLKKSDEMPMLTGGSTKARYLVEIRILYDVHAALLRQHHAAVASVGKGSRAGGDGARGKAGTEKKT